LQQFIQELSVLMTSWQATTFLIGDYALSGDQNPVLTVADGLIRLSQSVQRNSVVRKMEVAKMRGLSTVPGIHTFRISDAVISVFAPPQTASANESNWASPTDIRVRMGVPGLDVMMGGGLPKGYSLLVAGPSGSGKSILAAAFLAEGTRCGENGVIAAFEQRPTRSRGLVLADLIRSGSVGVINTHVPGLSVDEVAGLLLTEISRLNATRVVIDSLSGFELVLAPTFRDDFRESMARMVSVLASRGVTVLMTSELEDRYVDLRFSPYGTAFLTDAIIVQRYVEVESRLERIMAVVKVRASAHSSQLHQFHIDNDGIHIGAMMADHEGLLGGRPTQVDGTNRAINVKNAQ
jgi:circadian clock protein KaiC